MVLVCYSLLHSQSISSKQQNMNAFSEEFLSKNDFKTFLATFCCYDYVTKASEAIGKITINKKTVTVKKFGFQDTSSVAKKTEVAQKKEQ